MMEIFKNKKFLLGFAVALILIIAIPITIFEVQRSQQTRSRASGEAVSVILDPQSKTVKVADPLDVDVFVNGGQNDISAVDLTFSFGLVAAKFAPSDTFTTVVEEDNSSGIHYVGVNPTSNTIKGDRIKIGTLHLSTSIAGQGTVGFSNIHINAAGVAGTLPIDTQNTKEGTYTITGGSVPTHCGGNTATPQQCPTGFSCVIPSGQPSDVGGTCSPLPTGPTSSGTGVTVYISQIGIGANGGGENNSPKNPTRSVSLKLWDSQNNQIGGVATGSATYQPATGLFVGTIPVNVPDGNYTGAVRTNNTLYKKLSGIITITNGQTTQTQPVQLIPGDFNGDNEINLQDYNMLISASKQ